MPRRMELDFVNPVAEAVVCAKNGLILARELPMLAGFGGPSGFPKRGESIDDLTAAVRRERGERLDECGVLRHHVVVD